MSQQRVVGTVLDGATPLHFPFRVNREAEVPLHEYVSVNVKGRLILAEVISVGARNPLFRESYADGRMSGYEGYGYEVAVAEVLGYLESGRIMRPKIAPKPGSQVFLADEDELRRFYASGGGIPITVGSLLHRRNVPVSIDLNGMQFHLGIFAQTRGGKSYLAGVIMEEILKNTRFPVVVIDMHGDYVMMDRSAEENIRHGMFNVVVYYPPRAPRISGVTAESRTLKISPREMSNEALMELLGGLGPLQSIYVRRILKDLKSSGRPFSLADVIDRVEEKIGDEGTTNRERERLMSILARLEDLWEEVELPAEGTPISELLSEKTLSVICLRGLPARLQDVYTGLVIEQIFRNNVRHAGDYRRAPPVFIFIEEAHRVASQAASRYAAKTISTVIREGAKFRVFLALISQRPRSIDPDVLANIGNYAVLRITNAQDQNIIESASESFSHRLVEDLPALNQGEAVLVGPFVPLPAIIRVKSRETVHGGASEDLAEVNRRMTEERDEEW